MVIQNDIKCAIFDFDGTIGTFRINYDALRNELRTKTKRKFAFRPLVPTIYHVANTRAEVTTLFKIIDKHELESLTTCKLITKTAFNMMRYKLKGVKLVIITRNGSRMVTEFIKMFTPLVPQPDLICSRDECKNLKPHREQMDYILKKLRVKPEHCIMYGDSWHDKRLAKRSNVRFVRIINRSWLK